MPAGDLSGDGAIDPALVARFRADLTALIGDEVSRVGVAVSGGGDSLALLLLAHAAFAGRVAAATVDHGLRPQAPAEAAAVARSCALLGIPHATLTAKPRARPAGNLQDWARTARYRLLADWARTSGIATVATAHHRDDVAETFLMRAARGGGVRSLAAMPAIRSLAGSPVLLARPLLGWPRAELAAVVAAAGLKPMIDPSNVDARFDRVRIRNLLALTSELPGDGLSRAAANLRDVEEAFEWLMRRELAARLEEGDTEVWLRPGDLPFELRRRSAAHAVEAVRHKAGQFAEWRETGLPGLVRLLDRGGGGTVADVLATVRGERWHFCPAPPRRTG